MRCQDREWQPSPPVTLPDGYPAHGCCVIGCATGHKLGSFHPADDYAHWMCYPHWLEYLEHPAAALYGMPAPTRVEQPSLWKTGGA